MTTDTLRRLQALRGLTRVGSTNTVLAQVQGDLQTVIEAVLELADGNTSATAPESDYVPQIGPGLTVVKGRPPKLATDEPAIGEQVTNRGGDVWQRFEDGWCWWTGGSWFPSRRTWGFMQSDRSPLRATTDDDRRRVGLPVRDENTPPASQNGPQEARRADSGTGGPPEPEDAAQGRIGWLRLSPDDDDRIPVREIPGGWTDTDIEDGWHWLAENWPDAEFTPIHTLADDEVAVKRGVVDMVIERLERARIDAIEDGRTATATALQNSIAALEADR